MTIDVLKALPNDTKRNSQLPNVARSRRPVRRSLFGEVDHDESMKFLQQELNSIHESQSKRWNFDFQDEKPINSSSANYEWLPVQPNDEIPKAYALSRLPFLSANSECTSVQQTCDQPQSEDSHVELRLQESAVTSNVTKRTTSVQRSIRDFLKTKKRPSSIPVQSQKDAIPLPDSTSSLAASDTESSECYHPSFKKIRLC